LKKLIYMIKDPVNFFENVKGENWKPALTFFSKITLIISILTPIVNFLGIKSTDYSSSYQAQILAYKIVKEYLIPKYGALAYLIEPFLIIGLAYMLLFSMTIFFHILYRLMGGKGTILSTWKALCYGIGPCIFGGFLPYISLFAAFYSLLLQLYIGPKILHEIEESKMILFLAAVLALTFIEMFLTDTTISFLK